MKIIIAFGVSVLVVAAVLYAFFCPKRLLTFVQAGYGDFATLSVPTNFAAYPSSDLASGNLPGFFREEFGLSSHTSDRDPGNKPYYKDYTGRLTFQFLANGVKFYDEAGNGANFSHLIVTIYNSHLPPETVDQFMQIQPPRDISFGGGPVTWLNTVSGNGYVINAGVIKEGGPIVGKRRDLNVAIFTKNNARVALYTSANVISVEEARTVVEHAGNSLVINEETIKSFFASAAAIAKTEQAVADNNLKRLNTEIENLFCPSIKPGGLCTCGDYTYALSQDGRRFYFINTLFLVPPFPRLTFLEKVNKTINRDILDDGWITSYSTDDPHHSDVISLQQLPRFWLEDADIIAKLENIIKEGVTLSSVKLYSTRTYFLDSQRVGLLAEIEAVAPAKVKYNKLIFSKS